VIVGRYNQYFITSIVVIAEIVGSYNHFYYRCDKVLIVTTNYHAMTTIDVI
jgi:HJR/Mrr/RecB family endonuclease